MESLFFAAFRHSRNPMVLVEGNRRLKDVNGAYVRLSGFSRQHILGRFLYEFVVGGPVMSEGEWHAAVREGRFTGSAPLRCADGTATNVQYAATAEVVTGRALILAVVISTSQWGARFRRPDASAGRHAPLSTREREIVRHVASGSTGPEISDELGISHDTVRTHVRNAMDKLGARSRAHLVARALGDGLVLNPDSARRRVAGG